MDGCMAHDRGYERWGKVERVTRRLVIGFAAPVQMVFVRFDDGAVDWLPRSDFFAKGDHFERQY
jgi:hypothetical protein